MTLPVALALLAAATPNQVAIVDNAFRPGRLAVRRGEAVTWTWDGRRRHNVYFYPGSKEGRPLNCRKRREGRCTRRFARTGRYQYVCTLHGTMVGAVRVR